MTRRERLERKLQKRQEWAESRHAKFESEFEKSDMRESVSGIPFGQPILVGHHSERRHRRAIERADHAFSRASEHHKMAELHESKAEGLAAQLDSSIYNDDENAVEALEARIAKHEAERELNNKINAIIRKNPRAEVTPEKIAALVSLGMSDATAAKLFEKDFCGCIGIPSYVNQNLGGRIKADRDRLKRVKAQHANRAEAEESERGIVVSTNVYGDYLVTFAEKPDRSILRELKSAGYHWTGASWVGEKDKLPYCVKEMAGAEENSCQANNQ